MKQDLPGRHISSLKSNSTIIHVTSTSRSGYLKIPSTSPEPFWLEDHEGFGCFLQQPEISVDSRAELQRIAARKIGGLAVISLTSILEKNLGKGSSVLQT